MNDDTTPPAASVPAWLAELPHSEPERYRVEVVLPSAAFRQLAALAALQGVPVERLAADLVAEGLPRLLADERGDDPADHPRAANLAAMVNELTAEVAQLQTQRDAALSELFKLQGALGNTITAIQMMRAELERRSQDAGR